MLGPREEGLGRRTIAKEIGLEGTTLEFRHRTQKALPGSWVILRRSEYEPSAVAGGPELQCSIRLGFYSGLLSEDEQGRIAVNASTPQDWLHKIGVR